MDSSTWQLFAAGGLILILGIAAYLFSRRDQRVVSGQINPVPTVDLAGISKEDRQAQAGFVMTQVFDLNQVPWGEQAISDRREAERLYQQTLDVIANAEGDYD